MLTTDEIQRLADTLDIISKLTEQKFFAIGKSVEQAIQILALMAATFEGLHVELQSNSVAQVRQDLALTAAAAARLADAPVSEAAALERLTRMTEAINGRIAAMRQIARDVDILAMNARLTAAGMGNAGADFMGFAMEIRRSAEQALARLEQIGGELNGARLQLQAAHAGTTTFAERHGAALQAIPQRLSAAGNTLLAHDQLAAEATAALAARSAEVHHQLASMVVALQLGDITRQRVEHMRDMALVLLPLASPSMPSSSDWLALSPPDQRASLLNTGWDLAAAQLRDTAAELDQEAERIAVGLGQLATAAREIGHLGEQAYGAADQRHHGFIAELEANPRETAVMFERLNTARLETESRISSVLAAAQRLAGHIDTLRWLEADIRIMGLNTTLKCGRLGVIGRPLSVIAQELRDCGGRMGRQAEFALDELEHLRALAGSLDAAGRDARGADDHSTARTLIGALEPLGRKGLALSEALGRLDSDSAAASDLLLQAAGDFAMRHDIGEALHQAAVAPGSVVALEPAEGARTERLLALFAAVYTMAREREVHTRITQPKGAQLRETSPAEPDLEDVLF